MKNNVETATKASELMYGEYRGNSMIIIRTSPEDKFPFQFGVRKARLILEHYEAIKKFVAENTMEGL